LLKGRRDKPSRFARRGPGHLKGRLWFGRMDSYMGYETDPVFLRFFFGNARDDVIGPDMNFLLA
jgi:hypothetical protein